MAQIALAAKARPGTGTGEARSLRRIGRVPAVAYGTSLAATPLSVDARELYHALRTDAGLNAILRLEIEGDPHLALAREIQRHPVRREILHVDFVTVDRNRKVTVDVPLRLEGEAAGADEGGVADQGKFTLSVEVLPLEVPDELVLDISELQIGDVLRVEDVTIPEGAEALDDPEETVVSVYMPSLEVPEEDETEVLEQEPSIVGAESESLGEAAAADAGPVGEASDEG